MSLHCSRSGFSLVASGNITPAITSWHALFLGTAYVSCMMVLLCGPCTPCKAICTTTSRREYLLSFWPDMGTVSLLPFPRIICLLQSTFWEARVAGRQPRGSVSLQRLMGRLQDLPQCVGSGHSVSCSHLVYLLALP